MDLEEKRILYQEGKILLFDKPLKWTSFDVVKKVKYTLKYKFQLNKIKVGHAGTLDPLATGLMIICTGKSTKSINELQNYNKTYVATIELGRTTPSFDLETEYDQTYNFDHVDEKMIKEVLDSFLGEQEQVPPVFSAKYINGKRAYHLARKGVAVEMKPVRINISEIKFIEYKKPMLRFSVKCSKGTYVRSLARDIGIKLACGAHLVELKRTEIGSFTIADAQNIEHFEQIA